MARGSCMCGEIQYETTGDPAMKAACHCIPCHKTSGTPTSNNFIYSDDTFKITRGNVKTWSRTGDSGKAVTYHFCSTCPTLIYVKAEAMPGLNNVKLGTLDDKAAMSNPEWQAELYNKHRLPQCQPITGAQQVDGNM